jgi:hypothetical protein
MPVGKQPAQILRIFDARSPDPSDILRLPGSTNAAELLGNLGECACKGLKCKAYHVCPWRNGDRTEDYIGLQDLSRLAVPRLLATMDARHH